MILDKIDYFFPVNKIHNKNELIKNIKTVSYELVRLYLNETKVRKLIKSKKIAFILISLLTNLTFDKQRNIKKFNLNIVIFFLSIFFIKKIKLADLNINQKNRIFTLKIKLCNKYFLSWFFKENNNFFLKNFNDLITSNLKINHIEYFQKFIKKTEINLDVKQETLKLNKVINDKFKLIIQVIDDNPNFQTTLNSLLRSDYNGKIILCEDGIYDDYKLKRTAEKYNLGYFKAKNWAGNSANISDSVMQFCRDDDVVITSHSDVLFPNIWFNDFKNTWDDNDNIDKISQVNLSFIQVNSFFNKNAEALFYNCKYEELLNYINFNKNFNYKILNASIEPGFKYGFAKELWIENSKNLIFQMGRCGVVSSFRASDIFELNGLNKDLYVTYDLEILNLNIKKNRLPIFIRNKPLIHFKSRDTYSLDKKNRDIMGLRFSNMYEEFYKRFGFPVEHYINIFFSEIYPSISDKFFESLYEQKKSLNLDVYDMFAKKLKSMNHKKCHITWCRTCNLKTN